MSWSGNPAKFWACLSAPHPISYVFSSEKHLEKKAFVTALRNIPFAKEWGKCKDK